MAEKHMAEQWLMMAQKAGVQRASGDCEREVLAEMRTAMAGTQPAGLYDMQGFTDDRQDLQLATVTKAIMLPRRVCLAQHILSMLISTSPTAVPVPTIWQEA